jgi:hypothetical protein
MEKEEKNGQLKSFKLIHIKLELTWTENEDKHAKSPHVIKHSYMENVLWKFRNGSRLQVQWTWGYQKGKSKCCTFLHNQAMSKKKMNKQNCYPNTNEKQTNRSYFLFDRFQNINEQGKVALTGADKTLFGIRMFETLYPTLL